MVSFTLEQTVEPRHTAAFVGALRGPKPGGGGDFGVRTDALEVVLRIDVSNPPIVTTLIHDDDEAAYAVLEALFGREATSTLRPGQRANPQIEIVEPSDNLAAVGRLARLSLLQRAPVRRHRRPFWAAESVLIADSLCSVGIPLTAIRGEQLANLAKDLRQDGPLRLRIGNEPMISEAVRCGSRHASEPDQSTFRELELDLPSLDGQLLIGSLFSLASASAGSSPGPLDRLRASAAAGRLGAFQSDDPAKVERHDVLWPLLPETAIPEYRNAEPPLRVAREDRLSVSLEGAAQLTRSVLHARQIDSEGRVGSTCVLVPQDDGTWTGVMPRIPGDGRGGWFEVVEDPEMPPMPSLDEVNSQLRVQRAIGAIAQVEDPDS